MDTCETGAYIFLTCLSVFVRGKSDILHRGPVAVLEIQFSWNIEAPGAGRGGEFISVSI